MKMLERKVTMSGGRNGSIFAAQSDTKLKLSMPTEMGGSNEVKGTDPEELFAMGYATCFASSLEYLLNQDKIQFKSTKVEVITSLINQNNQGFNFELDVSVQIEGVDQIVTNKYIEIAKAFCPFSKAIANNVKVRFE